MRPYERRTKGYQIPLKVFISSRGAAIQPFMEVVTKFGHARKG